mmetsp:Transcript_37197/g.49360  ORF Transcript_37197/g.49360 Transcript_37197/m.49360 type:complete len:92 (-) Transcript_37197:672-947(-)
MSFSDNLLTWSMCVYLFLSFPGIPFPPFTGLYKISLCAESEAIGASTLETMGRQREQLENAAFHLEGTHAKIYQARQIMREMCVFSACFVI